jgi:general secretion pathway protein A
LAAAATVVTLAGAGAGLYLMLGVSEDAGTPHPATEFFGAEFSAVLEDDPGAISQGPTPPAEPTGAVAPSVANVRDTEIPMVNTLVETDPAVQSANAPSASDLWFSDQPATAAQSTETSDPEDFEVHIGLVRTLDQAAAVTLEDDPRGLRTRLAAYQEDKFRAYRQMFELWGETLQLGEEGNPCASVVSNVLRCFKGPTNWAELRGWNRPAVLRLYDELGQAREVLLRALDRTHVTLDLGDSGPIQYPIAEIDSLWAGHASVLWKLQTSVALFAEGARGEPVLWLRKHLSLLDGGDSTAPPDPEYYDPELAVRVKRFQADRGLAADGIVGQRTMLYLNNLDPLPGTPMLRPGDQQKAG